MALRYAVEDHPHAYRGMQMLRRLWETISEPRHLNVVYFFAYLVAFYIGVVTLLFPPSSVEGVIGEAIAFTWSILFMMSGVGGMSTCLIGWWKWERWSIFFGYAAIAIYSLVVIYLQFTQPGSRLTQHGMIIFGSFVYTVRLVFIRGYSFDPRR